MILAGQRATATWTGGAGVRINLSTVVTGMLARDSESRHAVGAENEIPDIAGYSGGEAGFFQIWSVRAKKILARALRQLRAVPQDLGEVYELIYEFVRSGGKLPRYGRWIEGANT